MPIFNMFFSLSGRIRRRDFWLYSIGITIAMWAANLTAYQLWGTGRTYFQALKLAETEPLGPFLLTVHAASLIAIFLRFPILAKRWHDRNRTAWIAIFTSAYALVNRGMVIAFHISNINHAPLIYTVLTWGWLPVALWILVECGCLDGTKEPNRYGPSPKTPVAQADVF